MNDKQKMTRRTVLLTGAALTLTAHTAFALPRTATGRFNNLGIKGYDTTAYFQHGEARKGDRDFEVEYQGATWRFESAAEADLFRAKPANYAPQFGGYCTRALSIERTVPGDPEVWRIRENKLYLFARTAGRDIYDEAPAAMISLAQAYWDTLDLT